MSKNILITSIRRQLGLELHMERRRRGLRLKNVQTLTGIPALLIDQIEIGKAHPPAALKKLLIFYKKQAKVSLVEQG